MALIISPKIRAKLAAKVPPVTPDEIEQCFRNRAGTFLIDTREEHASDPPTHWFIAETNTRRKLKVVFIPRLKRASTTAMQGNARDEQARQNSRFG